MDLDLSLNLVVAILAFTLTLWSFAVAFDKQIAATDRFFGDFQEESKSSEHYTEDWAEEAEEAEESEHQLEGLVSR